MASALKDRQVLKVLKVLLAPRVGPGLKARKERSALAVPLESPAPKASQGPLVQPGHKAHQDPRASPARKEQPVPKVLRA